MNMPQIGPYRIYEFIAYIWTNLPYALWHARMDIFIIDVYYGELWRAFLSL